ncbi:MAG: hypothetical protein MUP69_10230 [Candidatus Atribacteria bacterium]|nr:hypothetical protein [Candidatus Atribacteria bacterium]
MAGKQKFGIFSPVLGEKKDYPTILLDTTVQADNRNILTKYGEIWQRKMREATLLCSSLQIEACDEVWDDIEDEDVTQTMDSEDYKEGLGSVKWVIADGLLEEEIFAGKYIEEVDLSDYTSIRLWIKCSVETSAGDLILLLGDESDTFENLDIPALEANTWTEVNILLSDPSLCTAITLIMMEYFTDLGVCTIRIDDVRAIKEGTEITDKTQTPDGNPILHYHTFVKRATATQYLLAFTKKHIYLWNTSTFYWDLKWTCASDCIEWDTVSYNDMVIATNNVDKVLYWDTTGDFEPLDTASGIEYGRTYSNETYVDETSALDQKVLKVADTSGKITTDKIIIGRGTDREEEGVVDTVQSGISLTLVTNLTYEHKANVNTTVDADSADGQKVLNVASTTGFSVDEFVIINEGGDREETRKIYTIQAGISLTFTVDLTYTHTQGQGDAVIGTGGDDDIVEEYTSLYLTKAKYVTAFENYLELGYTYENEVSKPQRIRWSDIGNAEIEGSWRTGDSGSKETEGEEVVKGFGKYQGNLIIFKEKSYILQWLVSTRAIWGWKLMPSSIGCQSNHSIINDPAGRLYFYASDNTIRDIETGIISGDIDPVIKLINPEYAYLIQAFYMSESEEIWWSIPLESNLNNKVITLDKKGKWGEIDMSVPAFGEIKEE